MSCNFPDQSQLFEMIKSCGPYPNRTDIIRVLSAFNNCCVADIDEGLDPRLDPQTGLDAFGGEIACDIAAVVNPEGQVWVTFDQGSSWKHFWDTPASSVGQLVPYDVDMPNDIPQAIFYAFPTGLPETGVQWFINQKDTGAGATVPGDVFASFDNGQTMHWLGGQNEHIVLSRVLYDEAAEGYIPIIDTLNPDSNSQVVTPAGNSIPFVRNTLNFSVNDSNRHWTSLKHVDFLSDPHAIMPPYDVRVAMISVSVEAYDQSTVLGNTNNAQVIGILESAPVSLPIYPSEFSMLKQEITGVQTTRGETSYFMLQRLTGAKMTYIGPLKKDRIYQLVYSIEKSRPGVPPPIAKDITITVLQR